MIITIIKEDNKTVFTILDPRPAEPKRAMTTQNNNQLQKCDRNRISTHRYLTYGIIGSRLLHSNITHNSRGGKLEASYAHIAFTKN